MKRSVWQSNYSLLISELKVLRDSASITQSQLAKKLDKQQSYVSKYESGERRLDFLEVMEICNALNVNFPEFVFSFQEKLKKSYI